MEVANTKYVKNSLDTFGILYVCVKGFRDTFAECGNFEIPLFSNSAFHMIMCMP